jgi:dolichol-phosphate mannosyltransferase
MAMSAAAPRPAPPRPDVVVTLPAFNEREALPRLLRRIAAAPGGPYRTVVVDDGSEDGTAEAAEACRDVLPDLRVVRHGQNRGLGAALLTGWSAALEGLPGDGVVVTMDADDTHDPALIARLVELVAGGADVAVASRFQPGGGEVGLSLPRRVFSRGACLLLAALRPVPGVRDYTCGFRAYRAGLLRRAFEVFGREGLITAPGFACTAEVLLRLASLGARCAEAPLVLRYDLKRGKSKMKIARTIAGYLHVLRATRRAPAPPAPPVRRTT